MCLRTWKGGLPDELVRLGILRYPEVTGQDDVAELFDLLLEKEALIELHHDADVSKKSKDVVDMVDVDLYVLGKDDDLMDVHRHRNPDKMI